MGSTNNRKRPFLLAGLMGIPVVITSVILLIVFPSRVPKLPEGFITPIIAFEFVRTPQEVMDLFGQAGSPERQELVRAFDLGNRIDFLYMVLYTAFLFVFCQRVAFTRERKVYYLGCALSAAALLGDFLENMQLLSITSRLDTGVFERQLEMLRIFTWQKWGSIALVLLLLSPHFLQGATFSRIIGACSGVCALLGLAAYLFPGFANELFSLSVVVVFALMISYSIFHTQPGGTSWEKP